MQLNGLVFYAEWGTISHREQNLQTGIFINWKIINMEDWGSLKASTQIKLEIN